MDQTLYIIRGAAGSGKSTFVEDVLFPLHGTDLVHVEADQWWILQDIEWDPKRLMEAHRWCRETVDECLSKGKHVAVANTFIRQWEIAPYREIAERHGVRTHEIILCGERESVHGVPVDKILHMRNSIEPYQHLNNR